MSAFERSLEYHLQVSCGIAHSEVLSSRRLASLVHLAPRVRLTPIELQQDVFLFFENITIFSIPVIRLGAILWRYLRDAV